MSSSACRVFRTYSRVAFGHSAHCWTWAMCFAFSVRVRSWRSGQPAFVLIDEKSQLRCAGRNRHEAEDESSSRERSSDPLGLESCVATARDPTKRRQRIGGVGIQLRKDAIRTPTPL